jgi:hypothetical protein
MGIQIKLSLVGSDISDQDNVKSLELDRESNMSDLDILQGPWNPTDYRICPRGWIYPMGVGYV